MLNKNPSDCAEGKVCSIVKFYVSTLRAYCKFNSHNSTKLFIRDIEIRDNVEQIE